MAPKLDTLAKLYLESPPTAISPETQAELCAFVMEEFQELPFSAEFSDFRRYGNADEMFADIEQGHLWVEAESYDTDLYGNPFYGFAFLAIHDYDHYLTRSDFSLIGEITAYQAAASRAPSLEVQKILYSEIVLRAAVHLYLGHAPEPKLVFA